MVGSRIINIINSIDMKSIKLIVCILFLANIFVGCKEDEVKKQEEEYAYVPRIIGGDAAIPPNPAIFPNPSVVLTLKQGATFAFTGLQFAPVGKVSVVWKVDDVQVATGEKYTFTATTLGNHKIKVEASHNGTTVSRFKDVTVIP
jgi:hypothetical protein